MFYEMQRGRVGFISFEELQDDYVMYAIPERLVGECKGNLYNFRSDIYITNDLIFVVLDVIQLRDVFGEKDRVALFVKPEMTLIVAINDEKERIRGYFQQVVERYDSEKQSMGEAAPERFLYYFLDKFIQEDRIILENMEFHMSELETQMLKERINRGFINEILQWKRELMYIWNYYEQLIDLGEVLRDNENEIFPEVNTKKFAIFTERVQRLNENVKHLQEYTVQLRETHDAMLDYNLNSIMKFFTVITTVFMPLTLIVGWYGMNFKYMPELNWRYGYLGVVIFSVLVVLALVVAFKRHKLL